MVLQGSLMKSQQRLVPSAGDCSHTAGAWAGGKSLHMAAWGLLPAWRSQGSGTLTLLVC